MTLHQLEVFTTVAKLKSFTAASEKLHVRQPSISLLVQSLSRELGVQLFERLGNKVYLTDAGKKLLQRAEEILGKVDVIWEGIEHIKGLKKGKLAIGGSATAAASFLPLVVQKFKADHPGLEVALHIYQSEILERKLLDGELDVAVLSRCPRSQLILSKPYREEEIVIIAPADHPLAKRRSVSLDVLAKQPLISSEQNTPIRDMVEEAFEVGGFSFVPVLEVNYEWGARDAIRSAVAGGVGIGFLPRCHVASDLAAGRLIELNVPSLRLIQVVYVAVHKRRQNSSFVEAFLDFLKEHTEQPLSSVSLT
ncbi:MAG: LysR family transcriptional regulator [Candidatus Binatia bacterium]